MAQMRPFINKLYNLGPDAERRIEAIAGRREAYLTAAAQTLRLTSIEHYIRLYWAA